jgi:hypothetical protein
MNGWGEVIETRSLHYYWIAYEEEYTGQTSVLLHDKNGQLLAMVTPDFAEALTLEGTGVLKDGTMLNLHVACPETETGWCYRIVNPSRAPFGEGAYGPLVPFRSLSLDSKAGLAGEVLFIPSLRAVQIPAEYGDHGYHDGCVVVHDFGWSLDSTMVDLFVHRSYHREWMESYIATGEAVEIYRHSSMCPSQADAVMPFSK